MPELSDFETELLNRLNAIKGKFPKSTLSHYDFPLDPMIDQLNKFTFTTSGALKVDVTAIVADNVAISSPLYNGYVGVEDPRMTFSSGSLNVNATALVADKVYIWGSDYATSPTPYEVKVNSSGQLFIGNFPSIQAVSQSGSWSVNAVQSGVWAVEQAGSWNVDIGNFPPFTFTSTTNYLEVQVENTSIPVTQSGSWNVDIGNFPPFTFTATTNYLEVQVENTSIPVTQSGSWAVSVSNFPSIQAVSQSGTWNVGLNAGSNLIGKIDINSPLDTSGYLETHLMTALPSGSNTIGSVNAIQSGSWSVGLNAGTNTIGAISNTAFGVSSITRTTLSENGTTGQTSSSPGTYTSLQSGTTIVKSFTFLNNGTAVMYVGYNGAAARVIYPNGDRTFSADPNEQIDISQFWVVCPSAASQNYTINWET